MTYPSGRAYDNWLVAPIADDDELECPECDGIVAAEDDRLVCTECGWFEWID